MRTSCRFARQLAKRRFDERDRPFAILRTGGPRDLYGGRERGGGPHPTLLLRETRSRANRGRAINTVGLTA